MDSSCIFFWSLNASDCASWVQAWGTMLALGITLGVGWHQARRARSDRVHSEVLRVTERAAPALGIINGFVDCIEAAQQQARIDMVSSPRGVSDSFLASHKSHLKALQHVDATLMPSARLAQLVIQSTDIADRIDQQMQTGKASMVISTGTREVHEQILGDLLAELNVLQEGMKRELVRLTTDIER